MARTTSAVLALAVVCSSSSAPARAQDEPIEEQPDVTRLDVERLPPEAIEITRDLYAHGFFFEGHVGGRGLIGGAGRLALPGVYARVVAGVELARFFWIALGAEGSIHATDAPPPPSPTVFELLGLVGELRLQIDATARLAFWLGAEAGLTVATGDVLPAYGLDQSDALSPMFGGQLGIDWHMVHRHYSIGIAGGARLHPSLAGPDGEQAIGVHGTLYLRYVL